MKKIVFALLLAAAIFGCAKIGPVVLPTGVITIEAQSLPITKTLAWDDVDASITSYTVSQDGTVIGSPTVKTQSVTITTVGSHTFTIISNNLWGSSTPATLTVNVQLPTVASNARIQ